VNAPTSPYGKGEEAPLQEAIQFKTTATRMTARWRLSAQEKRRFRSSLMTQLFEVAARFHAWCRADVSGLDKSCRRFELVGQVLNPVNAQKHTQIIDLVRNPSQVLQFVHGAGSPADRGAIDLCRLEQADGSIDADQRAVMHNDP
jgi:hypothetical protein